MPTVAGLSVVSITSYPSAVLHTGDCVDILRTLPDASVDSCVTDPPYPCVKRSYGTLTVEEWEGMMWALIPEIRRVLKPHGSAVFILQPNSEHVGKMRPWLWDFMARICREWNMVQDAWWWNHSTPPCAFCQRKYGLMRPSLKACVWAGSPTCYRNQDAVLWSASDSMLAVKHEDRLARKLPSGVGIVRGRIADVVAERGGVTPFNLLPIANTNSVGSSGAHGHGAGSPLPLAEWWCRYLTPPGGVVLDPFSGAGTMGVAAVRQGFGYVGIERDADYMGMARVRLAAAGVTTADERKPAPSPAADWYTGLFAQKEETREAI